MHRIYRADTCLCLHKMLQKFIHSDLTAGRIQKDLKDVKSVMQSLTETFVIPFTDSPLLCISNGAVATGKVYSDLANMKTIGKNRMNTITEEQLSGNKPLFDPIKKLKLKRFSSMGKTVITGSDKIILPMKATQYLFGQIALIIQNRNLNLKNSLLTKQ